MEELEVHFPEGENPITKKYTFRKKTVENPLGAQRRLPSKTLQSISKIIGSL
jgi:hypothetical protein